MLNEASSSVKIYTRIYRRSFIIENFKHQIIIVSFIVFIPNLFVDRNFSSKREPQKKNG